MATLRDLAAQQGQSFDWNRINSLEGGGDKASREALMAWIRTLPGGGWGSNGPIDFYSNPNASGGGDNGGGGSEEGYGTNAGSLFGRDYFGGNASPVMYGTENGILSDRGDYNYAIPDLGAIDFDPVKGLVNSQDRIPGSRVNRSFNNFNTLTQATIAAMALGGGMDAYANGFGNAGAAQGAGGGFGSGGGVGGSGGYAPIDGGLTFQPGPSINPTGAFAGQGTGFTGSWGSGGLFGQGGGGGNLGLDPYEIDMAPGSVSTNQPGAFERMGNFGREAMNNPTGMLQRAGGWAMDNPMQALQLAGGLFGGGSPQGGGGSGGGEEAPWNPMQMTWQNQMPEAPIYRSMYNGKQLSDDEYLRKIGYGKG